MVEEWLEPTLSLCAEHGFAFFEARATASHGWLLIEQGQEDEGMARIRQGLDGMQATGSQIYVPMELAIMGEAHGRAGQPEKGLTTLAEALAVAHSTGGRLYEPEIHRLKGELLLTQGDDAGAKESFCQAVEVARVQNARSWELRATVSLCRLLANEGQREQARDMLSEVYGWFTEGFDTRDLQEAKALLEALF